MIIWLTIQAFQFVFAMQIDDSSLNFLRFIGFIELLSEIVLIIGLVFTVAFGAISTYFESKEEHPNA